MIFQNFEYLLKLNYDQFDKTLQKKKKKYKAYNFSWGSFAKQALKNQKNDFFFDKVLSGQTWP
jgi:hypothetical protein